MDLTLRYKKEFLKISLRIKAGEPRNCRFYCIFTFPYAVILLFLKNCLRYLKSDLTKTLPSACSKRRKKNLQVALKIKSPEWNKQTHRQTVRPILNFIDIDDNDNDNFIWPKNKNYNVT